MTAPRCILVPYDFTGPSKRACDYAAELAAARGARVCLVHVLERFGITLAPIDSAALRVVIDHELERAAGLLRRSVAEVDTRVIEGSAWEGIEAAVRETGADLIVMGTHGRRGLARALLGSVAARALRGASIPVMTVAEYVAVSRNAAGARLAVELNSVGLVRPNVVALSRGALTIATTIAERTSGTMDLWGVQPIHRNDGAVLGAIGEDGALMFDAGAPVVDEAAREAAVAVARHRLATELVGLKGARAFGECWERDVILVADGLFSTACAEVAVRAIRKLHPRRIVVATPIAASAVLAQLAAKEIDVVTLERALVTEACMYRDDVVASDVVAYELILAPHAQAS